MTSQATEPVDEQADDEMHRLVYELLCAALDEQDTNGAGREEV